jgi:hypothetical protein
VAELARQASPRGEVTLIDSENWVQGTLFDCWFFLVNLIFQPRDGRFEFFDSHTPAKSNASGI